MLRLARVTRMVLLAAAVMFMVAAVAHGLAPVDEVDRLHDPQAVPVDQMHLKDLVAQGRPEAAFDEAFELGDELFATRFNMLDGVGAYVNKYQRFTRVPRADLDGWHEWAEHTPRRIGGPNAQSCLECHDTPFEDGAGELSSNAVRDPERTARLSKFIIRQAPHLFGSGGIQKLAEEMSQELMLIRAGAKAEALRTGERVTRKLVTKGVSYGSITAIPARGRIRFDTSKVRGVSPSLLIRPFDWKGADATIREFNREAMNNELGMQPDEIVGARRDGDYDGVVGEMSVGQVTALTVYNAAQPRPTTRLELASLGLIPSLPETEAAAIRAGEASFATAGCTNCHIPSLTATDTVFSEPSRNRHYRDATFPSGQDPVTAGLCPTTPVSFDLTADQPDNRIELPDGGVFRLGAFRRGDNGGALIEMYGDLRRHDMGPRLAEPVENEHVSGTTFMTENLWGVASTQPYLHDGRASTLAEAIYLHGGEAYDERQAFRRLPVEAQRNVIAFLDNLVLFKQP